MSAYTKEAVAVWKGEGLAFQATVPSGATMELNNDGAHFGPAELVMVGLAGCTAMDVIDILRKKRQAVTGFEVRVTGERVEEHPRRFVSAQVVYRVTGHAIDPEAVRRAIQLSEEKYCTVAATLRPQVALTSSFEIVAAEPAAA